MPRSGLKLAVYQLADNRDAIGPIQGNGTNVEDGSNEYGAAKTNEVDENAQRGVQPDRVEWRLAALVNAVPVPGERDHLVA